MNSVEENTYAFDSSNNDLPLGRMEIEDICKEVKGRTLQVYLLLARAKDRDFGVREITQRLRFSSVSLAAYHLNKLESIDLVTKTSDNRYQVSEQLSLGSLEDFFVLKGKYLPKEAFFLAFASSSLLFALLFFFLKMWEPMLTLLLSNALIGTIYSLMRFISLYRRKDEEIR